MNKKGFALLETLIVVVIISGSLITLYYAYNYSVINENIRLYYDDVNYIYKTKYLMDNLEEEVTSISFSDDKIVYTLNEDIINEFNATEVFVLKADFNIISSCNNDNINGTHETKNIVCENSFSNINENTFKYIKTLGSDETITQNDYLLVAVYEEKDMINYASFKVEVPNE